MENVKTIAEFFLISLAFTYTLFSPIAPSHLTGNGFIKLISNLSIGSLVITLLMSLTSREALAPLGLVLKLTATVALTATAVFHRDQKSWTMWLLYALVVASLGVHIALFAKDGPSAFFLFSSTLLLGIITYAMILGHWYLVVPKLSEKPLLICAVLTWVILAIKIISSVLNTLNHMDFFESQTTLGAGYAFNWLLLTMRMSFGYVVILAMSFFNWKLVRIRSIQSSTGILYAMTFFIFIGELVSTYLFFNYGLFI